MADTIFTVLQIVVYTPIWVWGLYALLLWLGFLRTRDSALTVRRMLTLPIVVVLLTAWNLYTADPGMWPPMAIGLLVGGLCGWRLAGVVSFATTPDGRGRLWGDWPSFGLLIIVLVSRYVSAVAAAMEPVAASASNWLLAGTLASTLTSAFLVGRTMARLKAYFFHASNDTSMVVNEG